MEGPSGCKRASKRRRQRAGEPGARVGWYSFCLTFLFFKSLFIVGPPARHPPPATCCPLLPSVLFLIFLLSYLIVVECNIALLLIINDDNVIALSMCRKSSAWGLGFRTVPEIRKKRKKKKKPKERRKKKAQQREKEKPRCNGARSLLVRVGLF
jgi:hypothetical protein